MPGQVIGHVDAREVNATSAWLAQLVAQRDLPEKLFIVHQFTDDMVDDTQLQRRDGLAMVLNADGFGTPPRRSPSTTRSRAPRGAFDQGFKLFYEEDVGLMSPADVLALRPAPGRRGVRVGHARVPRLLAALAAAQVAYGQLPGGAGRGRRARSSG